MSFLKALKDSLSENTVLKHDFLLCYSRTEKIVHAFFEGKTDESFYGTFLRAELPNEWKLKSYICKNKDGVYYHFEKFKHMHLIAQPLLFFVDKDIEDVIPFPRIADDKIHVTDYYSVENYIVTSDLVERIWAEIFRQGSGNKVADEISRTFDKALCDAHLILLDMMAWILYHRRNGSRPNLDCITTKDLFTLDDSLVFTRTLGLEALYQYLDTKTKVSTNINEYSNIQTIRAELGRYEPKTVIRGHNEMDFLIVFYKKLKYITAKESGNKISPQPDITLSNVIDVLGPRVPMPSSLRVFFDSHFSSQMNLV
jgi:hypothetical protein